MRTEIYIYSALGHTPKTKRQGPYYDALIHKFIDAKNPLDAKEKVLALIRKTQHATSGHFNILKFWNQNTRSAWVHPEIRLLKTPMKNPAQKRPPKTRCPACGTVAAETVCHVCKTPRPGAPAKIVRKNPQGKKWFVFVERDKLPTLKYGPESGHRAFDRAHALCQLHGCQFTQDDKHATLTVHAGKYYNRPNERIRKNPGKRLTRKRAAALQRKHYARKKPRRNSIQKKPVHRKLFVLSIKAGTKWHELKAQRGSEKKARAEAQRLARIWRAPIKIQSRRG